MHQRLTSEWHRASLPRTRARALIEDPQAVWFSDYAQFRAAGFEVAVCTGPDDTGPVCPIIEGGRCELVDKADVVLCALPQADERGRAVFAGMRSSFPSKPVVLAQSARSDEVGEGTLSLRFPTSVPSQILALRRALTHRRPPEITHS